MVSRNFILCFWILLLHIGYSTGSSKKGGIVGTIGDKCEQDPHCVGHNLECNKTLRVCQCKSGHHIVVVTQLKTLCLKPTILGEDCLADESCLTVDANSVCFQKDMRAICQCKSVYHEIYDKSSSKFICVPEGQLINSDLATLIGIGVGMTLFCGLTCLVLRIFARARFGPRTHHYGNAQIPPPITLSRDDGEPRGPASRNSSQRSSLAESTRRQSGSLLAPPTRQGEGGSRRASNSSIRSTGSNRSQRSYSLRNPTHHNHIHQALQHRPSDPESRSQTSQLNLSLPVNRPSSQDNVSGGSNSSTTGPAPPYSNNSSTSATSQQPSPKPHQIQKSKRSGSAGALPV